MARLKMSKHDGIHVEAEDFEEQLYFSMNRPL